MWLVEQDAILTKDNMLKRNWHENPNCYFCNTTESSIHLFFECPVAKATWGIVAISLGHTSHPCSYEQFWRWVTMALPRGDDFYMLVWRQFAGQHENVVIECVLTRNLLKILVELYFLLVHL
jgi:hypothetical protein